jgi:hypothetical protein
MTGYNLIITLSFFIAMLLYYTLNTNVIYEYIKYIPKYLKFTESFFYGKLLLKSFESSNDDNLILYLNSVYNNFLTKLISCPICLGFWMSLIFSIFSNITYFPIISFVSIFSYYLINILTKLSAKL